MLWKPSITHSTYPVYLLYVRAHTHTQHSLNMCNATGWNLKRNHCSLKCSLVRSSKISEEPAACTFRVKDCPEDVGSRFLQNIVHFYKSTQHYIPEYTSFIFISNLAGACCFPACRIPGPSCSAWGWGVHSEWKLESVQYVFMACHGGQVSEWNGSVLFCA